MELFRGRYLCFLSFLFLLISLVCFKLEIGIKLALIILFTLLCIIAVIVMILGKKHRFVTFVSLLATASMLIAALSSFLFVSLPNEKAERYRGRYVARLEILLQERKGGDFSES